MAHDKSSNALLQARNVEVEQKSNLEMCVLEIGQQLGLMQTGNLIHRLQLDEHAPFDHEVGSVRAPEQQPLVLEIDMQFLLDSQTAERQFVKEAFPVGRFEETWTEHPMDLDRAADNRVRQLVHGPLHKQS